MSLRKIRALEGQLSRSLFPDEVYNQRMTVFKHQSQKNRALFPLGSNKREFWQRADEILKNTAKTYNQLGKIENEAMEVFVLLKNLKKRDTDLKEKINLPFESNMLIFFLFLKVFF